MIWELDGIAPQIAPDAWIAPDAQVMGRVVIEEGASVWWGAVLRGDTEEIRISAGANVQDGCVLHTDPGCPLVVGSDVTVGHKAILHGCTVESDVLVGMGAIVMNHARIGTGSLVAAGALVLEGTEVPPGSLVAGVPAKVRRPLTDEEQQHVRLNAEHYVGLARQHSA